MTPADETSGCYDVVVVGGGIAGASVAYELSVTTDVLLVEMEPTLGFHATARSAAMFLETYGGADVRALTMASRAFLEEPPSGFATPLLVSRPLLQFARPGRAEAIRRLSEEVGSLVRDIELVDEAGARELCPLFRPGVVEAALFEPSAREMDVDALHQGFARGFRERGGRIQRGTGVAGLTRRSDGWTVRLGDGRVVTGRTLVNAAGAWVDQVALLAGVAPLGFTPRRRTAFTTAAPDGAVLKHLPMLYDVDETFYAKPEGDQLLCSPADRTPSEPVDAKPDTLEIARALEELREVTTVPARSVRASWAGLRTFSPDENLVVGADPGVPEFFWLAGQGGYGMQTSPALARFAAAAITGAPAPADVLDLGLQPERISPARFATT